MLVRWCLFSSLLVEVARSLPWRPPIQSHSLMRL